MKIDNFKVKALYRGVSLNGICRVIYPSTYMVAMEVPYKGLSKAQHFFDANNGTFTMETIQGRAKWELGRLYEQYQDIKYNYAQYKKLMDEWTPYEERLQRLKDEVILCKQDTDKDNEVLLDFYMEALDAEARRFFDELTEKHGIQPLSLSPSVLAISLRLIDKERNNR